MIFGIDGNEANVREKVGVSVYTFNLLKYFQSHADTNHQFIVFLRTLPSDDLPKETKYYHYKVVWGPLLWSRIFLPLHLWFLFFVGIKLYVFFSPAHYIPFLCPFRTVVTIHDLSYLYYPEEFLKKDLYQLKNWTEYALRRSSHIITVSETTKKDVLKEYKIPEKKISVIHNGYEAPASTESIEIPPELKYFLYVGTIQPRKNISLLISAFVEFHKVNPQYKLLLVGKKGWLYESIFNQVEALHMEDSVLFLGYVSDAQKGSLYKHAVASIFPSLYEGFGIPLLEAMSHDCPVIASSLSSLPEIGGDACLYFDPKNSNELVKKMDSIVTDNELRKKLIAHGQKRIHHFSWNKAGESTLHILQSIYE